LASALVEGQAEPYLSRSVKGQASAACTRKNVSLIDEGTTSYGALARADSTLPSRVLGVALPHLAVNLHVRELGRRSGPTLVLLHGVFSDGHTWRFLTPLLAEDHRVLVVDLPGCGRSQGPDPRLQPDAYFIAWLARVIREGLAQFQDSDAPVFLVGHSLGANVALRALERVDRSGGAARIQGAVLIAPADPLAEEYPRVLRELAYLRGWEVSIGAALGVLDARIQGAVRRSVELPDERAFLAEAARLRSCLTDVTRRRASQAILRRFAESNEEARPPSGAAVLVWGGSDDVLPVEIGRRLSSRLGNLPLVTIPGAKHSVHQEAPAAVALQIRRFVNSHRGALS
jgi:pimeloyl-ACP methyl ester carboxylesterase